MRILALVTEAFGGFGGIAVYNCDLLTALAELPSCSKVTVLPRIIRSEPGSIPPKIEFREAAANGRVRYIWNLLRLLSQRESYDIVLCGHINLLPFAKLACVRSNAAHVLLIYGVDAWTATGRFLSDRWINHPDAVISISQFTANRFLRWSHVDENRVHLLPNAVHLERYGVGQKSRDLVSRYGLEGRKVLLTLGRLASSERQKGIDEMLEILPALIAADADIRYLIAGDGDDRPRLEQKAAALGVGTHVVFTGLVSEAEKADHYRLADAFVMPGRQEGFGFVFLEAMAAGIPVVASSLDGSREAVLDGKLGEMVDPDDREALKGAVLRALHRPRQVPNGLALYSYPEFRTRLQAIMQKIMMEKAA